MNALEMYTVYWNPKDYPNRFVVRRWTINSREAPVPREVIAVTLTLREARSKIPPGLFCMPRWPDDDRTIVEVWF